MTECLPNLPRFIIEREDGSWQGANHPDGPWRPIPAPHKCIRAVFNADRRFGHQPAPAAVPAEQWHEDMGPVLWWRFPVEEPPYCGSPLDASWPGYHTHFTPLVIPQSPQGGEVADA